MKIIVTGALGHIGSSLIRKLPEILINCEIVMIDNLSTQRYSALFELPKNNNYKFIQADILSLKSSPTELKKIFNNANVVIHLAAITDAASSFNNPSKVENNNFQATKIIADICAKFNIPLLFPSSTSVYGTQSSQVDEYCNQEELKPQSPYAESKLKEEKILQEYAKTKDLKMTICRFGTIFGVSPGMRFHTAVNKFCWQAVIGEKLTIWKTAYEQKRPYLDLNDAINAIGFFINKSLFNGQIYNVVTNNYTVKQVVDTIKQYIPSLQIDFVTNKIMNQLSYEVLNTKLNSHDFIFSGDLDLKIGDTIRLLQKINTIKELDKKLDKETKCAR